MKEKTHLFYILVYNHKKYFSLLNIQLRKLLIYTLMNADYLQNIVGGFNFVWEKRN
jgi:hypothetical protein